MVFCTYCGQSFTRDEHLERHILTHTNVKPFKCFTCHMSFARRDLLQRHYTVHGRNQNNEEGLPPQGIIPKSAGRTPIACSNCAKTKTKCDKKFPCTRCAQRNLKCTLRPTRRASKGVQRVGGPAETASGDSSESGSTTENQNNSGNTSPNHESQTQQSTAQSSPSQIQQPSQMPNGQPQSQRQSQSPSATHSRNPSISQPVQAPAHISPEEKTLHLSLTNTPPFFDQSPSHAISQAPSLLSPLPTPVTGMNNFVSSTPMSGYDDFVRTVRDQADNESPQFMMDPWQTMPMDTGFDPMRLDPSLMMSMGMEMSMGPPEGMLGMIPEMSPTQTFGHVQTPRVDESFSDLQIGSSASMFYPSNRQSSIADAGVPDLGAIIAAQDGWTVFRCTPSIASSSCPRTARLNLERLELSLKNHEGWSSWTPSWDESDFQQGGRIAVSKLQESTRDKLLAITQSFLHKALDIHKEGSSSSSSGESPGSTASHSNFVLLPPARVLEYFLKSYANSFERYYPTSARGVLDTNELMQNYNDKASSLLILMMIAQGAMTIPSVEARWLTGGFTEACRISLFDLIEKNIIMAGDPIVLRAALLFTVQAAWSGDKWQMDIAMGQRGMYFSMLRHSGILDVRPPTTPHMNGNSTTDALWKDWLQQESRSRLIYSWVMVDQDLSLFHDTAPLFSVTEFGAPMPDSDRLWQAQTASEWSDTFNQVHEFSNGYSSVGSGARPPSLRDLFRYFLDDEIVVQDVQEIHLTPMHLRLLLHPLQTLVCQYCQLLSCFSDSVASRSRNRALTAASTRVRLEEVQALLGRWFDLAQRYMKANPICPMMQANLVMFHLISMNAVSNFPEIERLARREGVDGSYQQMLWMHKKCLSDVQEAITHAGQVLRLIREMPRGIRPPWWAGAVYRAALILWTDSLTQNESISPNQQGAYQPPNAAFSVDRLPADHPTILRYMSRRDGIPTLTKRDGTPIPLDNGFAVLSHCVDVIDEGVATRFSDGIRSKLQKLARG
ncbi:transcription factor cmr1 [Stemphylium lycopersici]|uniref:Transcription factor cmr1 n=1 Tax=Stemphylium lycopersici TaxID=183478 RepID=A0A364NAM5_STELY|nr:transcription factor cmr1 [Stemphylium lycopersici]RAR09567.1 transcription factor cmr1 [Stemphylium lycopersici]RAR14223.1 transcription factor cmr1 [Stemphylium lycopersici]